jgi:tRNA modification GTPase
LAHTEAVIDFGDDDREGDINDSAMLPLKPVVAKMMKDIEKYLADGRRGEIIREGVQVALVGQPNAGLKFIPLIVGNILNFLLGKSSLLNALARRPAAIVSPIAGTTR